MRNKGILTFLLVFFTFCGGSGLAILLFGPDLVIPSLSGPGTGIVGQPIQITYSVKNQGESDAQAFSVKFFLSLDKQIIPLQDIYLGEQALSGLNAGNSDTQTLTLNIPLTIPAGSYYLGAIVDLDAKIPEKDEANNITLSPSIQISS